MPHALCPLLYALCSMPYALCRFTHDYSKAVLTVTYNSRAMAWSGVRGARVLSHFHNGK